MAYNEKHLVKLADLKALGTKQKEVAEQGAGTAGNNTAAQLDAHLLDAGRFALFNGNSVPAAGAVAQQLHLYQSYMGVFGSADAGQAGGNTVLGIAAHDLHDGQAAAAG